MNIRITLTLIFFLTFSLQGHANRCPRELTSEIKIQLSQEEKETLTDIEEILELEASPIDPKVSLVYQTSSRCYYEGMDVFGNFYTARINKQSENSEFKGYIKTGPFHFDFRLTNLPNETWTETNEMALTYLPEGCKNVNCDQAISLGFTSGTFFHE